MPIEEKPQLLEFNCTVEGMGDIVWNVKYDPNDKIGLHIAGNGQTFHCPVELLGDVTNFLRSKNIIKPDIVTRTAPTPGFKAGSFTSSLLPPQVELPGGVTVNSPISPGTPMEALTSFDITATETDPPVQSKIAVGEGPVVTAETKSEPINRAVIRSRVVEGDPQSAEKEAAMLRGTGKAGAARTVKKKHQAE